jgi:hypothetical protein
MPNFTVYMLWCFVDGDNSHGYFPVKIRSSSIIHMLREHIHENKKNGILRGVDVSDLALYKVCPSGFPCKTS